MKPSFAFFLFSWEQESLFMCLRRDWECVCGPLAPLKQLHGGLEDTSGRPDGFWPPLKKCVCSSVLNQIVVLLISTINFSLHTYVYIYCGYLSDSYFSWLRHQLVLTSHLWSQLYDTGKVKFSLSDGQAFINSSFFITPFVCLLNL